MDGTSLLKHFKSNTDAFYASFGTVHSTAQEFAGLWRVWRHLIPTFVSSVRRLPFQPVEVRGTKLVRTLLGMFMYSSPGAWRLLQRSFDAFDKLTVQGGSQG